jgi:hypothetical protein
MVVQKTGSGTKCSTNITGSRHSLKRQQKFKYIYYNGVWDINELFDLEADPYEMNNLIRDTKYRQVGLQLKSELFQWLGETNGLQIPLKPTINNRIDNLYRGTY